MKQTLKDIRDPGRRDVSDLSAIIGRHIQAAGLLVVASVWAWQLWTDGGNSKAQRAVLASLGDWPALYLSAVVVVLIIGQCSRVAKVIGGFLLMAASLTMAGASALSGMHDIALSLLGLTILLFGFVLLSAGGGGK